MLRFVEVSKVYRDGAMGYPVLDGVNFTLARGELAVLTGPSGSGKTTLLNLAGCLTRPTRGCVYLLGDDLGRLPEHFLSEVRRQTVGFVFQQYHLLPGYTARENVEIPLIPLGVAARARRERADALLARVGLAARADAPVQRLSGGEQQRVALARALVNDPQLILADEPTAHVDADTARLLLALFLELREQGRTLLVASHDPAWQQAGGTVYAVSGGQVRPVASACPIVL